MPWCWGCAWSQGNLGVGVQEGTREIFVLTPSISQASSC